MVDARPDPNAVYSLGTSPGETDRLLRQADELLGANTALVDRTRLGPGDAAIDFGCGPRGILELLSSRVGPTGRVVGVDAEARFVALAEAMVARRSLGNVEVLLADARNTGLPSSSFDVTHARTLLVTIPQPEEVLEEMVRVTKPGGWVLGFEADIGGSICYPDHAAYERLLELCERVIDRNGANQRIGRRVAELFRSAGLVDVQVESRADTYPLGHTRRTVRLDLVRALRSPLVEFGLCTEAELDELLTAADAHLDNPETVVVPHFSFLVSGRKRHNP